MTQKQKAANDGRQNKEEDLKGTFASVLILGGILAVSWLVVFIIFMVRNGG